MDSDKILSSLGLSPTQSVFSNLRAFIVKLDWEIKLLLAFPLVLICLYDGWLFSNILGIDIDSWIYFGYFIDLKQHLNTFDGTYYGTRLPWILPGFLAYKFFSPLIANYILHFTFYYFSSISFFLILKYLVNRRIALLTCILMSSYFYFIQPMGSNYIDGAGITYLLLTLLMLTPKENCQNPQLRLLTAGVFFGCLIYTQLFFITYIPLLVLYCFFMKHECEQRPFIVRLGYFIYGFVGISLLFCIINYCLNGKFFFYMPIINWTSNFVSGVNPWWTPISTWWMRAWWLLFPAITLFGSLFFFMLNYRVKSPLNWQFLVFFQALFIINLLMFVFLDLFVKQPVLSHAFYASYLIPTMFLAIGSQFSIFISTLSRHGYYLLLGIIVLISFLPYAFSIDLTSMQSFYSVLAVIVFGITGLFIIHRYYHSVGVVLLFISLAIINISVLNSQIYLTTRHDSAFHKQSFLSLIKVSQFVLSLDPQNKAFFWYDLKEPSGCIFRCLSSMNLWGYRLINEEFPKIPGTVLNRLPVLHDRIFLLSNKENAIEEANKSFASLGFIGEPINEKTIAHADMSYKITYVKLSNLEEISQEVGSCNPSR